MNRFSSMIDNSNLNKINERTLLFENRRLSFPSIADGLFNDISIRENLKRKFSADKILPRSGIFYVKQGHKNVFYQNRPRNIHYDSYYPNHQRPNSSTEEIFTLFSKRENSTVRINSFLLCIAYLIIFDLLSLHIV